MFEFEVPIGEPFALLVTLARDALVDIGRDSSVLLNVALDNVAWLGSLDKGPLDGRSDRIAMVAVKVSVIHVDGFVDCTVGRYEKSVKVSLGADTALVVVSETRYELYDSSLAESSPLCSKYEPEDNDTDELSGIDKLVSP
jgi:hypothetical protein